MNTTIDYTAYWAAALARHKARVAAGCLPTVGAVRVGAGAKQDEATEDTPDENA